MRSPTGPTPSPRVLPVPVRRPCRQRRAAGAGVGAGRGRRPSRAPASGQADVHLEGGRRRGPAAYSSTMRSIARRRSEHRRTEGRVGVEPGRQHPRAAADHARTSARSERATSSPPWHTGELELDLVGEAGPRDDAVARHPPAAPPPAHRPGAEQLAGRVDEHQLLLDPDAEGPAGAKSGITRREPTAVGRIPARPTTPRGCPAHARQPACATRRGGSESRTTLCQALATCRQRGAVVAQAVGGEQRADRPGELAVAVAGQVGEEVVLDLVGQVAAQDVQPARAGDVGRARASAAGTTRPATPTRRARTPRRSTPPRGSGRT